MILCADNLPSEKGMEGEFTFPEGEAGHWPDWKTFMGLLQIEWVKNESNSLAEARCEGVRAAGLAGKGRPKRHNPGSATLAVGDFHSTKRMDEVAEENPK